MSNSAAILICPSCGAEIPPDLLACPGCRQLLHAARLSALAEEAAAAQQAGDVSQALACWRAALELLPPDTNQAALIRTHIEQLGRQLDKPTTGSPAAQPPGNQPSGSQSSGSKSPAGKAVAGLGVLGMLLWKLKIVLLFVLTKGKLLLLGLTKSRTFLSMFTFFAVYWAAFGWPFALGLVVSIYIHEMGHVDALRRYGFKATRPCSFVLGALIRLQQHPTNSAEDARIGLAGPLWGMGAMPACYLVFLVTVAKVWAAIAHLVRLYQHLQFDPHWLPGRRPWFPLLSRGQAMLTTVAFGCAWFLTHEPIIMIVAIVALYRAVTKPKDGEADRTVCVLFLFLIASLSALISVAGTT